MNYKFVFHNDGAFLGLMDADNWSDSDFYYVFDDFWDAYAFFRKNENLFFPNERKSND